VLIRKIGMIAQQASLAFAVLLVVSSFCLFTSAPVLEIFMQVFSLLSSPLRKLFTEQAGKG